MRGHCRRKEDAMTKKMEEKTLLAKPKQSKTANHAAGATENILKKNYAL
jgi:hypothetical protein